MSEKNKIRTIFVKDQLGVRPDGERTVTIYFEQHSHPTVKDLQAQIQKKIGYSPDWYRLVAKGKHVNMWNPNQKLSCLESTCLTNEMTLYMLRNCGRQEWDDFYVDFYVDLKKKILETWPVCCICLDKPQTNIYTYPCWHHEFCLDCISKLDKCPLCRAKIDFIS